MADYFWSMNKWGAHRCLSSTQKTLNILQSHCNWIKVAYQSCDMSESPLREVTKAAFTLHGSSDPIQIFFLPFGTDCIWPTIMWAVKKHMNSITFRLVSGLIQLWNKPSTGLIFGLVLNSNWAGLVSLTWQPVSTVHLPRVLSPSAGVGNVGPGGPKSCRV